MENKRVILAIVLSMAVTAGWWYLVMPRLEPPRPNVAGAGGAPAQVAPPGTPGTTVPPAPSAAPGTAVPPVPGAAPGGAQPAAPAPAAPGAPAAAPVAQPEQRTVLETAEQRFVFNNRGAGLERAVLKDKKYLQNRDDPGSGLDLVAAASPGEAALRISFPESKFATPADVAWELVREEPARSDRVIYRAESGGARIEKHFRLDPTRFRMHVDVTVENRSGAPLDHHLAVHLFGRQDPEGRGSFFTGPLGNTANVLCHLDDETERVPIDNLGDKPLHKVGGVRWVATDQKFFVTAVVPYPETPPRQRQCDGRAVRAEIGEGVLSFAGRPLAPGARTQYALAVFVGPKVFDDLEQVKPGGEDAKLAEVVDVTLAVLSRPLLGLLKLFHRVAGNWGVAIILLTIFIRLITFYPTQRSLLSAKKMQKLAPKMAAIRKKYEGDRQRQSVETMNLYKAHGVSPLGGCLPSLIQMPIWIALYSTLNYAVELYRAPFVLHIKDLTAKDPFHLGPIPVPLTPLLMGVVMFVQMKMSPTSPDAQQQKMMAVMMPVMFTAFSLFLPSGLAVYMLTSYLIGILQQLWVNHLDRKASAPAVPAGPRGERPRGGG
jgi:YidC/Oxa1 family membrane protein insertase